MCNKTIYNYPHALGFASECFKTQKICGKIVDQYKTQEMCGRIVSEDLYLIVYCPDKY